MAKLISEMAKYEDMVEAIYADKDSIDWVSYISRGNMQAASSVKVCDASDRLVKMGFADKIVYDKTHFLLHQRSSVQWHHGHNGTMAEMLRLPKMLERPVAIITDKNRADPKDAGYQPLLFLCVDKDTQNNQIYRIAAVQPRDVYNGVFEQYEAAKVITYYSIDKKNFDGMLKTALHNYDNPKDKQQYNRREHMALYFDARRYNTIVPQNISQDIASHKSFACKINGYYKQMYQDIDRYIRRRSENVTRCAEVEAKRFVNTNYLNYEDTYFTPLTKAQECLESRTASIGDVLQARQIIEKVCDVIDDQILEQQVREKADILLARAYIRIMTTEFRYELVSNAIDMIEKSDAMVSGDRNEIEKQINDIISCSTVSTTESAGIKFDESLVNNRDVSRAMQISNELTTQMRTDLNQFVEREFSKKAHQGQARPLSNSNQDINAPGDDGEIGREP